ncbi:hypothetical protein VVMO6_02530 [Vibrio vulnificus MO6-24/O]|nr:hypothetical protein VVMO6_02530 [Vibrio vulnificus MO6-24/O]
MNPLVFNVPLFMFISSFSLFLDRKTIVKDLFELFLYLLSL